MGRHQETLHYCIGARTGSRHKNDPESCTNQSTARSRPGSSDDEGVLFIVYNLLFLGIHGGRATLFFDIHTHTRAFDAGWRLTCLI